MLEIVHNCRVCNSTNLVLVKKSNLDSVLDSNHFAITDSHYGQTLDLYACEECGLIQSRRLEDVNSFYEGLQDKEYENTRAERARQARQIVMGLTKLMPTGRLFDVGAGSGILVEQALELGYTASGLEPSTWLQEQAQQRGLPVLAGVLPDERVGDNFDLVTLVDVIEHVDDPFGLLLDIKAILRPNGLLLLTTPDVDSLLARCLGWRWWHFRVAHISYFNLKTIRRLLERAGFQIISVKRPGWYFTLDYLWLRLNQYLPKKLRLPAPAFFSKLTIPLNLFDSYELICKVIK